MENGRSIRVSSTPLPRNSNLAMHQAAATPKAAFSGTAIAATSRVSLIAETASGSRTEAMYLPIPLAKASWNTTNSGSSTSPAITAAEANTSSTANPGRRTLEIGRAATVMPAPFSPATAAGR